MYDCLSSIEKHAKLFQLCMDQMCHLLISVKRLSVQGTKYFGTQPNGRLTVETTAYALLAQIHLAEITYSYPIVLWLMSQRDQIKQWYSTQVDNIVIVIGYIATR